MLSILAIISGIYCNQFKCIYMKNPTLFLDILFNFQNQHENLNILEKELQPHSLSIFEMIHS